MRFYRDFLKRLFDILISLSALLILWPLILLIAIVLFFQNKGNVFFLQERPGKDQRAFKVFKFKTMTDERDSTGKLLPDYKRITPFGRFLRASSLDELPQLFNVLLGHMSLVGPRPLLFRYIPLHQPWQLIRYEVRPGITGWAQVNGRNSLTWAQKFRLDAEYVEKCSFWFDLKILYLTFLKVLKAEGIQNSQTHPMPPFDGTN
ncbi:sugar transferase [Thermaurantimonas aggregans]|uniref:Sugar transferase n=1 Tax=Thermaurantimonas aggregans TaxID=2173829 RepID=A0A401XK63_9FLAO|nr:sugar transferase [Thermaurantimonas aggregans]MCX8148565.1 sugar transferase [Thermaurantimonas aggregans]GCD77361.1 sugar transferase [Thermaurantimonas aggregans]